MVLNAHHSPLDMIMLLSHPGIMFFGKFFMFLTHRLKMFPILSISSFVIQQRIRFRQRMLRSSNMSVRFLYDLFGARELIDLMS